MHKKGKHKTVCPSSHRESVFLRECAVCGSKKLLSERLGVCGECLRHGSEEALQKIREVHKQGRRVFGLPFEPPRSESGLECRVCANECVIASGERGYCGLVENEGGKLKRLAGTPERGLLEWYYDPLPTNCVAEWCCPAGTGAGFPKFAYKDGAEYGYLNLAVFYGACSFDCLFCQNSHFKQNTKDMSPILSAEVLARKVNDKVSCICYFGGDPAPQFPHSIITSEIAIEESKGRILRVCWETNGTENWAILKRGADISLTSGGCIKLDLKAFTESVNIALCGVSNSRTLENFRRLAELVQERPEPPFLVASTLLVPGYIEVEEVEKIASFIAQIDPEIPYSLLAFSPHYLMNDLPTTSLRTANECMSAAKSVGLKRVKIGNIQLLS
jgi:pyruvate formate lyase activating enzyme